MTQIFALQQTTQELRDQIRTSVQDQIRAAQGQEGRMVINTPDGKTVTIDRPGALTNGPNNSVNITAAEARDMLRGMDVPPRAEGIAYAFLFTLAAMVILGPIARAYARRINMRAEQPQVPSQVAAQLTQLTQAVDSIAIEVERISEGQRFTTKLLSEQQKAAKALPSP
ncbi:MAG: hypothetical protein H0W69_06510 [Gemmatimonadaceae bacterium]|nr:hypothetical protein [Gemmatimonadaceae bacterium]